MTPPFSDNLACFDVLADKYSEFCYVTPSPLNTASDIEVGFEKLHSLVMKGNTAVTDRLALASELADLAFSLVRELATKSPNSVRRQAMLLSGAA
jgi:hypothetical protein